MQKNHRRTALTSTLLLVLAACSGSSGGAPAAGSYTLATDRGARVTAISGGATNLLGSPAAREGLRLDTNPVTPPAHGTLVLFEDGTFSYVHDDSPGGTDGFAFRVVRIADPSSSSIGQVTITITDPEPTPFAAADDSFDQAIGNLPFHVGRPVGTELAVRISGSVLANDGGAATVVTQADLTTGSGAAVDMHPDGSFSVSFLPGFSGVDSFGYIAQDGSGTPETATVTITVGTPIWFVGDVDGPGPGDGHAANPFRTLDALDAAQMSGAGTPGPGETIYLLPGAYRGSLTLLDGQTLHGAGERFVRGAFALPEADPVRILNSRGDCLTCANDNTIRGVHITNTLGVGLIAEDCTNLVVRGMDIVGEGQAMRLLRSSVDLELGSVQSLNAAVRGIDVEDCSGSITIAGDVTVTTPSDEGLRIAGLAAGSAVTIGGDLAIVAPGINDAMILQAVDGTFACGAVTISGRTLGGIRIDDSDGTITLGDVEVPNPDEVVGAPFAVFQGVANITMHSLDVTDVSPGATPIEEETGAGLVVRDFDGHLSITGLGLQGNGGHIDAETGGSAIRIDGGSPTLAFTGMQLGPTAFHAVHLVDNAGIVALRNVTIRDFAGGFGLDPGGANGIAITGASGHVSLALIECRFDGDSSDQHVGPGIGIAATPDQDSQRSWEVVLGDPQEELLACHFEDLSSAVDLTNHAADTTCRFEAYHATVRNVDSTGFRVQVDAPGATNRIRIFDGTFDAAHPDNHPDGMVVATTRGTNLVWIRDNELLACADGIRFETAGGTLSARVATNVVTGFLRDGIRIGCNGATVDVEVVGNTLIEADAPVGPTEPVPATNGIHLQEPGDARIHVASNSVTGTFGGTPGSAALQVEMIAAAGSLDLTTVDCSLGGVQGEPLVEVQVDTAGTQVRMRFQDQNGGEVGIQHDDGSIGIEQLGTLAEDNGGMSLSVTGTAANVTALSSGTVQLPTVILP